MNYMMLMEVNSLPVILVVHGILIVIYELSSDCYVTLTIVSFPSCNLYPY